MTLNDYIGKIVKNILQAGGDILKFAGDAILAVWKVKERPDLAHAVLQVTKQLTFNKIVDQVPVPSRML